MKARKWFRGLLGFRKPEESSPNPKQSKKRWSFGKQSKEKERVTAARVEGVDSHAAAVAAATARVAEAAIAAAQAAAAVVQLTSSGRNNCGDGGAWTEKSEVGVDRYGDCGAWTEKLTASDNRYGDGYEIREELAAVKIQSYFRAYLSRRALRALKALVRLQARVKGYLVRKHMREYTEYAADTLRSLQAVVRAQSRARVGLPKIYESPHSSAKSVQFLHPPGPPTPEKFEQVIHMRSVQNEETLMLKRNISKRRVIGEQEKARSNRMDSWSWEQNNLGYSRSGPIDDVKSDKILEIDTGKPIFVPKNRNLFHSSHLSLNSDNYSQSLTNSKESTAHQTVHSPSYFEAQSLSPQKFIHQITENDNCYCTADNSPQFHSASSSKGGYSSRIGPFTPSKSDSRSCLSGYSDHPNYMSYTESAKAKMRSLSAPKQRPQYDRSCSTKRYSIHGYGELRTNSQRASTLHANFAGNKAYPGSGRLDSFGMPLVRDHVPFSGGLWHRY